VVGLDILNCLTTNLDLTRKLLQGRIFFILTNLPAFEAYQDLVNNKVEIGHNQLIATRFVEENLNRACSAENLQSSTSKDMQRVKELLPILHQLELILDIHSTYTPAQSMLILTKKTFAKYREVFNTHQELVGITELQVGKPFIDIVERNGG
jgi:superfamily II helicase